MLLAEKRGCSAQPTAPSAPSLLHVIRINRKKLNTNIMDYSRERISVGVPFYEGEPMESFKFLLKNLDLSLSLLGIDADITILVNGRTATEKRTKDRFQSEKDQSRLNADVHILFSDKAHKASAVNEFIRRAQGEQLEKVFITDADIYRFPNSLKNLWAAGSQGYDVAGARSIVFPPEVLHEHARPLSDEERFWYSVFEGDKHPSICKKVDAMVGRTGRLRGGLMLINVVDLDADAIQPKHMVTSDKHINEWVAAERKKLVEEAVFMHFGRISLVDHIRARVRRLKDKKQKGSQRDLQPMQINAQPLEEIIDTLRKLEPKRNDLIGLFLLRMALRNEVRNFLLMMDNKPSCEDQGISSRDYRAFIRQAQDYPTAVRIIKQLFFNARHSLAEINPENGGAITQIETRVPIDMQEIMDDPRYRQKYLGIILDSLGIDEEGFGRI